MVIAESMKGLTSDILASYDARVKSLGGIIADTHKTIKGFAAEKKEMATKLTESLSNFTKDLAKDVSGLLKEFGKNRKQMSEVQAKNLANLVKNLTKDVSSLLNGFKKDRKETSEELKDKLTKEIKDIQAAVKNIVNNTQTLIGEYHSDMGKARDAWQKMESVLVKSRKEDVMPRIEAREKVATAEEVVKKKKRGKKRGKK